MKFCNEINTRENKKENKLSYDGGANKAGEGKTVYKTQKHWPKR